MKSISEERKADKHIALSLGQKLELYLLSHLGCCLSKNYIKKNKLLTLFTKVKQRLEQDLDIVHILKSIKDFRSFLKQYQKQNNWKAGSKEHVINLDTS